MQTQKTLESPRLASLQHALTNGNTAALEAFWQTILEDGAPLVEAIVDDERHHLVTFLWRARGETQKVVVCGGPAGLDQPQNNQMTRLLETDLWYKTYQVQTDLRGVYSFSVDDSITGTADEGTGLHFIPDPLNPLVSHKENEITAGKEIVLSVLELPNAPPQPWIRVQPDVRKGQVELHHMRSKILGNQRRVWVYTPADYTKSAEPYGLLLLFDGLMYTNLIPTPTILDNLVHAGKLPPLVTVMLDNPDQETRNRELPCHQPFVDFLTKELMPWVHEQYHVTNNPAQSIVGGASYGGLAATFVGLRASEIFGNVLSQSGSLWWDKDPEEDIAQERIIQQFIASPHLPLRFSFEVGLKEDWGWINMVTANRHFRDVLVLKGYQVEYAEFNGYHHFVSWRGSLADRLITLVGLAST